MDLNPNCNRSHSLDDDNFSNISRISYGLHNSLNSAANSDSECSGPVSVRDMIQHYNNQYRKEDCSQSNHKIKYKLNTAKRPNQSQHLLAATKSSYCGLNNYGSHINTTGKQFTDQLENKSFKMFEEHNDSTAITCCKNCTACMCCQNRSRTNSNTTTKMLQSNNENKTQQFENSVSATNATAAGGGASDGVCLRRSSTKCKKINAEATRILAVENCTNKYNDVAKTTATDINASNSNKPSILNDFYKAAAEPNKDSAGLFNKHNSQVVVMEQQQKQKNRLLSTDSVVEEAKICQQPTAIETSYQSKTTIAKTSSGVRIIIDIFFDQERCSNNVNDIVGSRVETDIPQSHILSEFQQQTMAANENSNPKFFNTTNSATSYHDL